MQPVIPVRLGLSWLVAAAGIGFLFWLPPPRPPQQYKMVDDLIGEGLARWRDTDLKVHGWVVAGSLMQANVDGELRQTFVLQKAGKRLRVFARGPLPDVFHDLSEIVVTGQLAAPSALQPVADALCAGAGPGRDCPRVDAEQPMVLDGSIIAFKCTGKYDGAPRNAAGGFDVPQPEFR